MDLQKIEVSQNTFYFSSTCKGGKRGESSVNLGSSKASNSQALAIISP